jgi:XTP/dITP diphosphohydrolase
MIPLIFATNNVHKLQEAAAILGNNVSLTTPLQYGICEEIPETQATIKDNALQKARYIYECLHRNCFADDTGLEVDALDGAPGVHSARYAGEQKDMTANKQKLLCKLQDITMRTARFRTVIALILDGKEYLFEGVIEGAIAESATGGSGFGYDGLFVPHGYTQTFAQMSAIQKNTISHRARALQAMKMFLETKISGCS